MSWEKFLIPAILIITGIIMLLIPNSTVFAYKTKTASTNEQTQEFCNILSARILIALGRRLDNSSCADAEYRVRAFRFQKYERFGAAYYRGGFAVITADS